MKNGKVILFFLAMVLSSCGGTKFDIKEGQGAWLKNTYNVKNTNECEMLFDLIGSDKLESGSLDFPDEHEYYVPGGKKNIRVKLYYGFGSEKYTVNRRQFFENFDFNIDIKPNKRYRAESVVEDRAVTLWLVDNENNIITPKTRKLLKPVLPRGTPGSFIIVIPGRF